MQRETGPGDGWGGDAARGDRTEASVRRLEQGLLLERARGGDPEAMDELVRLYYPRVYNLAFRLCGNYDDAQDLALDAFVRASRAIAEFRGEANFTTWLYSIVRNVFLSNCKRSRRREICSLDEMVGQDEGGVTREVEDPTPGPEGVLERRESAAMVQQAVDALPETQRLMVVLYHFQFLSYDEIAEVMKMPVGTVKSRLNRARLALKATLGRSRDLLGYGGRG